MSGKPASIADHIDTPSVATYVSALEALIATQVEDPAWKNWRTSASANVWQAGISEGIQSQFDWICDRNQRLSKTPDLRELLGDIERIGAQLASPLTESSWLLDIRNDEDLCRKLVRLGGKAGGQGRRFRMELLAAGWLVCYFYGVRNDHLLTGMLRLTSIARACPVGLSYWVISGFMLDEERYQIAHNMHQKDVYIARIKPPFLFGKPESEVPTAPEIELDAIGELGALYYLGHLYGELQLALTTRALAAYKGRNGTGPSVRVLVSQKQIHPYLQERLDAWRDTGCLHVRFVPNEEDLLRTGRGVFGGANGLAYYASEDATYEVVKDGPEYQAYRLEREILHSRRDAFRSLWKLAQEEA